MKGNRIDAVKGLLALVLVCAPVALLNPFSRAIAQTTFPPNPLEPTAEPDPLLPRLVIERPLSPQERSVLRASLDELQAQGEARLRAGDVTTAFTIWNRELRLRRVLGAEEEVAALRRVGAIAWQQNQTTEVRIITQRLQAIEQELQAQSPLNYGLLLTIAEAYQTLRSREPAVALYNQLLERARQQQNQNREQQILTALGSLHLAWFDYVNAATVYQDLRQLAQARGDRAREVQALQQLAYIHQQGNQSEQAIATQLELVTLHERNRDYLRIPPLKLSIGDHYLALDRPDRAAASYQEAFAVARSGQQYAYASEALQRLADLYRALDRLDDALVVYQVLLDVERQSYSTLGIINAYDQMGQVYRAQGNQAQAIASFNRALELARQLNYKVSYFTSQIEAMTPQAQP